MEDVKQSLAVKQLVVGSYATGDLPANAADGTVAYDSTTNKLQIRANGSWEAITSA